MVFRADEDVEERPRFAREPPKESDLVGRKLRATANERTAHPPHDGGRGEPQEQYRSGYRQRGWRGCGQINRGRASDEWGDPHRAERVDEVRARGPVELAANVAGRIPLEQPPPRDQHAHDP